MENHSVPEPQSFHQFFEDWLVEQNQLLGDLLSVVRAHQTGSSPNDQEAMQVVERVVQHYEAYYQEKERWARHDVLAMLTPSWRSLLEHAFLWIGGWRPSMAFQLLYSKSGLQFGSGLVTYFQRLGSRDLGDISGQQLGSLDDLQRETIKEERELTEDMAKRQDTIADSSMVRLSHAWSDVLRNSNLATDQHNEQQYQNAVVSTLAQKKAELVLILKDADELRMSTLKGVLDILTPMQAVNFLIAAAELHLRVHDWGKKMEAGQLVTIS